MVVSDAPFNAGRVTKFGYADVVPYPASSGRFSHTLVIHLNRDRITARQIDELVGIARGLVADDRISNAEVEFLQKWLAANLAISNQPMIAVLFERVTGILSDGLLDEDEAAELLDTLQRFANRDIEAGEAFKATSLPLCHPAPPLTFPDQRYCFTGTFNFGQRPWC